MDILIGSTDQWVRVRAMTTAGVALTGKLAADFAFWYARHGAAPVSIAPLADKSPGDAHADGGIYEEGRGWYWVAVPDAAFVTGVPSVGVSGTVAGGVVLDAPITLETMSGKLDTIVAAVGSGYWCIVRHVVGDVDGNDKWTLIPMKDFASQASATAVVLTVKKRSDGSTLINAAACTQVGATAVWKYTATTTERINDGTDCYDAVVTFTCDAGSRTAPPVIIARDG